MKKKKEIEIFKTFISAFKINERNMDEIIEDKFIGHNLCINENHTNKKRRRIYKRIRPTLPQKVWCTKKKRENAYEQLSRYALFASELLPILSHKQLVNK